MNTKSGEQKLVLCGIAMLLGVLGSGCYTRQAATTVQNKPSVEVESPPVEIAQTKADVSDTDSPPREPDIETAGSATASGAIATPSEPPQSWYVQRIIALSATGPLVIDVSVNIGGLEPDKAAEAATWRAASKITAEMEKPWSWEKLLDHPLVRSGWLGNLVPDAKQREDLVKMYNTDGDDEVDEEEMLAFLTRGLARGAAFRFTDIGSAPGTSASRSPWEQLDTNRDSSLDNKEIGDLQKVFRRLDLNADGVVTAAEMQTIRTQGAMGSMVNSGFLGNKSAMVVGPDLKPDQIARNLLDHYTSLANISREQWSGWSDKQWRNFDTDGDLEIGKDELKPITTVAPDLEIKIQFQIDTTIAATLSANVCSGSDLKWISRQNTTGQAIGKSAALAVTVSDSYTAANKSLFRNQLALALNDSQIETFLRSQLELKENAFDLLDADDDKKLSDEEFENAWEWLTAIRGSRILARWMLAESAWFRMADTDADGRLTEVEMQKFPDFLRGLDRDQDGELAPIEMPLAVRLEVARTDNRPAMNFPKTAEKSTVEIGWFAASDSNSDGSISHTEFLGSAEDFSAYDTDNDGFISASEAYKSPASGVQ